MIWHLSHGKPERHCRAPPPTKEDERDEAGFLTLRRIETSLINFLFIIESKLEGRMQS